MNLRSIASCLLVLPALAGTARAQAPTPPPAVPESDPAPQPAPAGTAQAPAPVYVPAEGAPPTQEAQSAPVPVQAYYAPPPPPDQPLQQPGARLHDGFYLRLSLGFGAGSATQDYSSSEIKYSGTAMMFDIMIGGSPMPGFVLGGALVSHRIMSPSIKLNGTDMGSADSDASLDMSTIGLFTAVYPDPSSGFNVHALVGYGVISASNGNARTTDNPAGLSLMGGVGYDFWVSEQWSLGPDVRVAYAKTSYTEGDGIEDKISMFVPTVSFTATYH